MACSGEVAHTHLVIPTGNELPVIVSKAGVPLQRGRQAGKPLLHLLQSTERVLIHAWCGVVQVLCT